MSLDDIAARLSALDDRPEPAVIRFDDSSGFRGRVAVLPSAFNPPTIAHLGLLELAATVPGIGACAAMLSTRNVDKGLHGASLADRVGMLLEVRRDEPGLAVLATNAARIADQARALRESFSGADFDMVLGYDTLVRLFDARYYDDMHAALGDLFAHHRVITTNRGEAGLPHVEAFLARPEVAPFREGIVVRELDPHRAALSSTAVRVAAGNGEEHAAVPPPVAAYIRERGLYREQAPSTASR
ncbi:MAG: hypothetical protein ACM3S1_09575 [Hyphomicrobiales bacterium]